jgi:hypothetical protein
MYSVEVNRTVLFTSALYEALLVPKAEERVKRKPVEKHQGGRECRLKNRFDGTLNLTQIRALILGGYQKSFYMPSSGIHIEQGKID